MLSQFYNKKLRRTKTRNLTNNENLLRSFYEEVSKSPYYLLLIYLRLFYTAPIYMVRKLYNLIFLLCLFSTIAFSKNNLSNIQLYCPTLLWGFEFISSNRVKVIKTDLNKITTVKEYYYDVDLELSYINIFSSRDTIRDRVYSIEHNSLRVDVWTMTGGGFTTREMFPIGHCKFVEIKNLLSHIENLK